MGKISILLDGIKNIYTNNRTVIKAAAKTNTAYELGDEAGLFNGIYKQVKDIANNYNSNNYQLIESYKYLHNLK